MAREIVIDGDTLIGYSFPLKEFYIENKGFTTYREKAEKAKEVLDIVAPANTVTIEDLIALRDNLEALTSLTYTWEDKGAYIKTIQLNTYEENPLTIDLEKYKLYIMNTNLIYDLTLNEGSRERILYLTNYYVDTLGLEVSYEDMEGLYNELISYYKTSYVYNYISSYRNEKDLKDLKYSNEFALADYSNISPAKYSCTYNPNSTEHGEDFSYVVYMNQDSNTIQITDPSLLTELNIGDTVKVIGAVVEASGQTFSADGDYTIQKIQDNLIQTKEQIPVSYTTEFTPLYKVPTQLTIASIDRDINKITLTQAVPSTIKVGDIVYVKGANSNIEGQEVSADGEYIVSQLQDNYIITQELIPASYTPSAQTAILYTKQELAYVKEVTSTDRLITLYSAPLYDLSIGNVLELNNTFYTIQTIPSQTTITVQEAIPSFTEYFPTLQVNKPDTLVKINVTASNKPKDFPIGEFMLDTFNQCKSYVNTLQGLPYPTISIEQNIYGAVPTTKEITLGSGTYNMTLRGLYSTVYSE